MKVRGLFSLATVMFLALPSLPAYAGGMVIMESIKAHVENHQTRAPRVDRGTGVIMESRQAQPNPVEQLLTTLLDALLK